jgi:hypothetical protein
VDGRKIGRPLRGPVANYCTWNVVVAVFVPPSWHVTDAFAVPVFVLEATLQVHETRPSDPAVGWVCSPLAFDTEPEGHVTFAEHVAPGLVFAVMVALDPVSAGLGTSTNFTNSATTGLGVGAGVALGLAVAEGAFVAEGLDDPAAADCVGFGLGFEAAGSPGVGRLVPAAVTGVDVGGDRRLATPRTATTTAPMMTTFWRPDADFQAPRFVAIPPPT